MAQRSMFWDGAVTGDCGPYSSQYFMDYFWRVITNGTGNQGVLANWLNELEVTDGGANTAIVATGASINYGMFYENDVAVNVNVPNGPRTDLIVIRRSWAAQTSRITRIAGPGAALVQTPGVTYDIPLASVDVNGAGVLIITDTRDFCEFSTIPPTGSVGTIHIQNDAVTTGKMINQTRYLSRGAGTLYPDGTTPATWADHTVDEPYEDAWSLTVAPNTDSVWCTFRVPEDFTGANVSIRSWIRWPQTGGGNIVLAFSAWVAAPSGVLANQTGTATITVPTTYFGAYQRSRMLWYYTIGNCPVTAGDIVHMRFYRNGAGADTFTGTVYLYMVEVNYTADS